MAATQRPGKAGYTSLYNDDDIDGLQTDPARAFARCPSERSVWPEYASSLLSRLGFTWFDPMVKLGTKTPLEMSDLWLLHDNESSAKNCSEFDVLWQNEVRRVAEINAAELAGNRHEQQADSSHTEDGQGTAMPTLIRPMFHFCGAEVLRAGLLLLLSNCAKWMMPLLVQQILLLVEGSEEARVSSENAYFLAIAVGLCTVVDFLCNAHYTWCTLKAAWHVRQSLVGLLFAKVTRLSPGTRASYSQGKITNMMSQDVERARWIVRVFNDLWMIPLRFAVALTLVIHVLGAVSALAGLVVIIVLVPITRIFIRKLRAFQKKILKHTDERVKQTQEVMSGIRIIKLMAWESSFAEKIGLSRDGELKAIRKSAVY